MLATDKILVACIGKWLHKLRHGGFCAAESRRVFNVMAAVILLYVVNKHDELLPASTGDGKHCCKQPSTVVLLLAPVVQNRPNRAWSEHVQTWVKS
jgi:hypothetical protein